MTRISIWSLRRTLGNIQHNIKHYEDMHEYDISPESREKTLSDLRKDEEDLLAAIALLEKL